MASVRIEVTQEDIDKGVPDPTCCPVARAIHRCIGILPWVAVGEETITIDNDVLVTPAPVAEFINCFDDVWDEGCSVEPFAFELNIPDDLLALATA